jgi:beta-phosphoglucomutase
MLAGCLFDLDGVLVDTARHHFVAWKKLAEEQLGVSFTHQDNEALKGLSRVESLDYILSKSTTTASSDQKLEWMNMKNNWYLDAVQSITPHDLLPGAHALLQSLQEAGIPAALGSASKNAPMIIEQLGIGKFLSAVVDGNVVTLSKPHPAVFLKGAELLGIEPTKTVVFEDAQSGVQAAKAGEFYCVGIGRKEDLTGADQVVPDLSFITIEKLKNWLNNN